MQIPWERIRRLEIFVRRKVQLQKAGRLLSVHRGRGIEFDRVRVYSPGDDVRSIDWNVSARMQQPFVKIYHEERQMKVAVLVDAGATMRFASVERTKLEFAKEVALLTGLVSIEQGDECSLVIPGEGIASAATHRLAQWLRCIQANEEKKTLPESVWQRSLRRASLCVYCSDFRHEAELDTIQKISQR